MPGGGPHGLWANGTGLRAGLGSSSIRMIDATAPATAVISATQNPRSSDAPNVDGSTAGEFPEVPTPANSPKHEIATAPPNPARARYRGARVTGRQNNSRS